MNIKKALEKIIEWQGAASQLKPYLPVGDKVLTTWFKSLQNFKKFLPILHKLANDALKVYNLILSSYCMLQGWGFFCLFWKISCV